MFQLLLYKCYFYLISFPVVFMWSLFCILNKKAAYQIVNYYSLDQKISLTLLNSSLPLLKYLNIPLDILSGRISIIGTSLSRSMDKITNSGLDLSPGLVSLYDVRRLAKAPGNTRISSDDEQLKKYRGPFDKLVILILYFWNKIFFFEDDSCSSNLNLLGINLLNTSSSEVLKLMDVNKQKAFYFLNANNLNQSYKYPGYRNLLIQNEYNLVDGSGVNIACRLTKQKLIENLNGTDLFEKIASYCVQRNLRVYFLGACDKNLKAAVDKVSSRYSGIQIVGYHNGYFEDSEQVIDEISNKSVDVLFVAMGTPYQELWVDKYRKSICASSIYCVGGLFDFLSENKKRAPGFLRECGLEWCYRLYLEPKRMFKRYLVGNLVFLVRILKSMFSK